MSRASRARYNSTLRIQDLISPKCALPSRIVKEQHSFQPWRLPLTPIATLERCRTQSIGLAWTLAVDPRIAHLTWWSWTGSNRRPPACKAGALPTELQPRDGGQRPLQPLPRLDRTGVAPAWHVPGAVAFVVGLDGFEPSTPALSRRCSNQLSYRPARFVVGCVAVTQSIGCGY